MRFSTTLYSLLLALAGGFGTTAFGLLPRAVAAQAVEVDAGTFVVQLGGRAVGNESFLIRRSGFGDNARTIAEGTIEIVEDGTTLAVRSLLGALGVLILALAELVYRVVLIFTGNVGFPI